MYDGFQRYNPVILFLKRRIRYNGMPVVLYVTNYNQTSFKKN